MYYGESMRYWKAHWQRQFSAWQQESPYEKSRATRWGPAMLARASSNTDLQFVLVSSPSTTCSSTLPRRHTSKDRNRRTTLRTSPEVSAVRCHACVTWDLHCWAISVIIFYLLEINFWWSHVQMENRGFEDLHPANKIYIPWKAEKAIISCLLKLHCLFPFGTHTHTARDACTHAPIMER